MKRIKNKLRSRAGASMILAMMFMLFCSFVGGSVLASATANAQRVAQMAEQQDFLLERSAALLVSDQLQLEQGQYIRLIVTDSHKTIKEMKMLNQGGAFEETERSAVQRVITFQVRSSVPMTSMHQLMLESTVYRYLRELPMDDPADEIVLIGFPGGVTSMDQFLFKYTLPTVESNDYQIQGTLAVSATVSGSSGVSIPDYVANFSSGRAEHLYDFFVDFGSNSQVKMTMDAYTGSNNPITVDSPVSEGAVPGEANPTGYIQITTVSTQHTISWVNPLIEKGGAQ
jgi:hypothetical protein